MFDYNHPDEIIDEDIFKFDDLPPYDDCYNCMGRGYLQHGGAFECPTCGGSGLLSAKWPKSNLDPDDPDAPPF
ncbi:hypothetical protein I8752_24990 [Nostocaceae cyanobacterium CENA369]|uniref:Uncharacterized protein n=1 Tax=Dendronalium phyllosphericum CENA369 TaxID=1725256 RepID=A0A8J7LKP6_9NOST|nr:hypothetical protein [Dendronalium phyllosphericum]MBH8576189.1 hypothetical protein [Dendronalium phyllosphericum CENA369]